MNTFQELSIKRESCRKFSDIKVDHKLLQTMVETARNAPSACNSQPWSVICVNNEDLSPKVAACLQKAGMNKFTNNCPAFMVICQEPAKLAERLGEIRDHQEFASVDLGIAVAHLCLEATDLGLSTCIIGWINREELADLLEIPEPGKIKVVLAIGYSENDSLREKKRKDIGDIVLNIF